MAEHVAGYKDEWAGVLEDEEKLSRFVSFVNAPDEPDPTIDFDGASGRKVPVLLGTPQPGAARRERMNLDVSTVDVTHGATDVATSWTDRVPTRPI